MEAGAGKITCNDESSKEESTAEKGEESADEKPAADDEVEEGSGRNGDPESEGANDESGNSGNTKDAGDDEERGRIPYHETSDISGGEDGSNSFEVVDDIEDPNERAASDVEKILTSVASEIVCEREEQNRTDVLNSDAGKVPLTAAHEGVTMTIKRAARVPETYIEQYDEISPMIKSISKRLQKSVAQVLRDRERGGKMTNLPMGRRLNIRSFAREDGKVFSKQILPDEQAKVAVALLLDESGSMGGSNRCTYARTAALIINDFCEASKTPLCVYGHTADTGAGSFSVEMFSYVEYEKVDNNDKYRLMDISARGNNRDGAALMYVAEKLMKRPEKNKLLILVSDGQPAASGYSGSAAEADLLSIKQYYKRRGIHLIAAAIGSDKEAIKRIYQDGYLDITDLDKLPQALTSIIKDYIV